MRVEQIYPFGITFCPLRGCLRAVRVSKLSRTASGLHPWLTGVGRTGSKNNSRTATQPIVTALRGCMRAVRVSKASRTASQQHPWLMEVGRTGSKIVPIRPHGLWLTATDHTGRRKTPRVGLSARELGPTDRNRPFPWTRD